MTLLGSLRCCTTPSSYIILPLYTKQAALSDGSVEEGKPVALLVNEVNDL